MGWVVGGLFDPTHAEIRAAAEDLVPEGAIVTERGENIGHPLIAGAYFAHVRFEVAGVSDLDSVLHERARTLGYTSEHAEVMRCGIIRQVVREPLRARLVAFTVLPGEGKVIGDVQVKVDPEARRRRQVVGGVSGGLAGTSLSLLLIWRKAIRTPSPTSG